VIIYIYIYIYISTANCFGGLSGMAKAYQVKYFLLAYQPINNVCILQKLKKRERIMLLIEFKGDNFICNILLMEINNNNNNNNNMVINMVIISATTKNWNSAKRHTK